MQKTTNCCLPFPVMSDQVTYASLRVRKRTGYRLPAQMLRIMRLLSFFLFAALLSVYAEGKAQPVTISGKGLTLKQVFNAIEKQTGFVFLTKKGTLSGTKSLSLSVHDMPLTDVLDMVLKDQPVNYAIEGKTIVLSRRTPVAPAAIQQGVTASLPVDITGRITDSLGSPVEGVSVRLTPGNKGATTASNGSFSIINILPGNYTLEISAVGYETITRSISVAENTPLALGTITIKATVGDLGEVVVVGFGTQKKQFVTGSVARANIDEFRNAPNSNFVQMLQGTVPGLSVGQVTTSGATPSIQIRGASTISGNTDVLIVLDGIQYNGSLQSINPDDIASIDVLKDASATAVYGAQAANGVILVTTKKGRNQKPRISVSSSYATQNPKQKNLRPMGRAGYLEHVRMLYYQQAYLAPDYTTPNPDFDLAQYVTPAMVVNGVIPDTDFDWWDRGTQTGHLFDNKISIAGGSENNTYLLSYNSTEQLGFIIEDKFKRHSIRLNLETKVADWWSVGIQSFATFINKDGAEPTLPDLIRTSPLLTPFREDGTLIPNPDNSIVLNPFLANFVNDLERDNFLFANFYSEIKFPFLKGLSYRVNYGHNYRNFKRYRASEYGAGLTGEAYKHTINYYDYTLDNILTYKRDFGRHGIESTLLYGAIERQNESTNANANNFAQLTLGYDGLAQGGVQTVSSDAWKEALNYQMARLNYKFDNKYVITGTVRRDGFSGFARNHKWGYFPSVSAAWILSEESFFPATWIDHLKLRAGYGTSGNLTSRYASLSRVSSSAAYIFGDGGSPAFGQMQNSLGNADLRWEKVAGTNIGLDFELLNARLSGNIDVYSNITTDLLFAVAIPTATGYSTINTNIGRIRNRGVELALTSRNMTKTHFDWNTTLAFSTNTNKILTLLGQDADGDGKEDDLIASNLFIGHSLGAIYGYRADGLYQLHDDIRAGYFPGTFRIVDLNGDDVITPADDRTILGRSEPAYRVSLLNTFRYRNISLSIFFNSVQGGKNGYLGFNSNPIVVNDNTVRFNWLNGMSYWQPGNPDGENPLSVTAPAITPAIYKDRSFIRLQDVNLSYDFSNKFTRKLHLQQLNLFVSGKNLATWTKWKGWDPETNQGMTVDGRPVIKAYSVGMNVTF